MKNVVKGVLFLFIVSLVAISCDKDDDDMPAALVSFSYSPSKMDAKEKEAFNSKEAKMNPSDASANFEITKVTKGNNNFTNPKTGGMSIDGKGKISAKKDHKLTKGTYVLEVTATDKTDKNNQKKVSFTVTLK
jgi:hypothetical protein